MWSFTDELGCELGQKIQPLDRVGVYVPGGKAAYPSSVLMTLIPAKVAGVEEIVVCHPPPLVSVTTWCWRHCTWPGLIGCLRWVALAVAALAYGTESVPRVDKIVGPGNALSPQRRSRCLVKWVST